MAKRHSTRGKALVKRAGIYLRYSSSQQDGSDEQQDAEIRKLCDREGYQVVATYTDQAITGDSGRERRPGLAAALDAAARGEFDILVAWDMSRIGRQDSADAGEILRALKQAGVVIHTCRDGRIDPRDSMDRLRYHFSAEGSNLENRRRAYNVVRGLVGNAEKGNCNGGRFVNFGLDRAQFDQAGRLVRRLKPRQQKDDPRHTVRLIPSEDQDKLAALRYAFKRYAEADIGMRSLAMEMNAKGYPSPTGKGWSHRALGPILRNPIYRGRRRWGAKAVGKYHTVQAGDIVPRETYNGAKPPEDAIVANGVTAGIVPAKLFDQVQQKLAGRGSKKITRKAEPVTLRETLRQMISRIECRWEQTSPPGAKRRRSRLIGGTVILRDHELFACLLGGGHYAEA